MSKGKYTKLLYGAVTAAVVFGFLLFSCRNGETDTITLESLASPLVSASDLDRLVDNAGEAKFVLLGESSHGTSEYYRWRAKITRRLIEEKGFSFIAVEGDWPYIYHTNRYVKGLEGAAENGSEALERDNRWPEWMWANRDFLELVEWLRSYNHELPLEKRVGLYGMDMQNMPGSIQAAVSSLEKVDHDLSLKLRRHYICLARLHGNMSRYAQSYMAEGVNCEEDTRGALEGLREEYGRERLFGSGELFDIKQNMLAVEYGERYAREMTGRGPESWNTRVRFMKGTVGRLSERYGEGSKGIVWAHNTHVGDARATGMADAGMVNIGQLLREKHGESEVFILGFGTHRGRVMAGRRWGEERMEMTIPPAVQGSLEDILSQVDIPAFMMIFGNEPLPDVLTEPMGHRAKGVVYNPESDIRNYVPTVLNRRYDAFVFFGETTALDPL